jgi:hypothetical protein
MAMALNLGDALRSAHLADPDSILDVVLRVAGGMDAADVVVYLVDFAQTTLEPVPDGSRRADAPQAEAVATSMAGRAFLGQCVISAVRAGGVRVWVPILEGSDRSGVLAVTVPLASEEVVKACEELGLFVGYLLATQGRTTDLYHQHRRRRPLSLPASMQWDLLPPLVLKTKRIAVAGLLEPAYDVAGDCFDYALNGATFDLGLFDPLGHGIASTLMAALCVGTYRHDRRDAQTLENMHSHLDINTALEFPRKFATGQLARVDVDTGEMMWTNAGHPLPMLIRGGQVIREMQCTPSVPWGIGSLLPPAQLPVVATEALEPGDCVLFYTDGVVEAHLPGGEYFGVDRLADLAGQHASDELEPEEITRRLVRSVLEHQGDRLSDDATLVLFQWYGPYQ